MAKDPRSIPGCSMPAGNHLFKQRAGQDLDENDTMKTAIKKFKRAIMASGKYLGLYAFLRWYRRRYATILMFHGFTEQKVGGLENSQHKHLHVEKFEKFLQMLVKSYCVIPLSKLVECLNCGSLPAGSVALTFDDGFLSNYTIAFPLLRQYGVPATIFLATEFVDEKKPIWVDRIDYALACAGKEYEELVRTKKMLKSLPASELIPAVMEIENRLGYRLEDANNPEVPLTYHAMDWAHLIEMQSSGLIELGAHTHSHLILGHSEKSVAEHEIKKSKELIEREIGKECNLFCYPNGGPGDFSEETEAILKQLGFHCSLTTVGGFVEPGGSPFLLKRLGVTNDLTVLQLEAMMCGI